MHYRGDPGPARPANHRYSTEQNTVQRVIEYVSRPLPDDYTGLNSRLTPWFRQLLVLFEIETVNNIC